MMNDKQPRLRLFVILSDLMKLYSAIFLIFSNLVAQGGAVSGRVTDSTNDSPLIGANVILEGTSLGAATDGEGRYKIEGLDAGEERNWIGKVIKINNVSFKVEKNIPRCVAINLKPKTDDNSLNLLQSLKKTYNHFDMGIYLTSLEDGKIEIGNKIEITN